MVKPYLPTITVSISREFDGEVCDVRKVSVCLNSIDADRFEDALDMVIDGAQSHARVQPTVETSAAPKVIEETCSWCSGVGQIGTPGTSCSFCNGEGVRRRDTENTGTAPKIKRGDRVRVALSADNVIPTDGWIVDRLPTREWSCYGLTHENGGTMSINMDLVTLADPATQF